MFGPGPKKEAAPEAAWAVQILTRDYLMDGLNQPDQYCLADTDALARAAQGARHQGLSLHGID
jgi:hypothetical protein